MPVPPIHILIWVWSPACFLSSFEGIVAVRTISGRLGDSLMTLNVGQPRFCVRLDLCQESAHDAEFLYGQVVLFGNGLDLRLGKLHSGSTDALRP